ncbi:uncharacterized protein N7518_000398 [Penicillium psychrosexuale]|uniref:uncharacterized protein n=1 Tax=Penicillium psychrosexuale TaxID=1002107 RepID=UPI0025457423|nr:uncharacterized protein N7518_000398 [Penicillium psychrosexuale]KAJ5804095.1 hypothetical protein N7518_000398 [Penicillium psychrosexuale]
MPEIQPQPHKFLRSLFRPSFFQPHPDRLLQLYPPRPDVQEQEEFLRLSPIPSIQDIMNDSDMNYSPEVAPTFANLHRYDINRYELVNDALAQARQIERIIDCHMTIPRQGPSRFFILEPLRKQEYWRQVGCKQFYMLLHFKMKLTTHSPHYKKGDPPFMNSLNDPLRKWWRVMNQYRYIDRPRKPHMVMTCISNVRPTNTNRGITIHKLKAIVSTLLRRVNHKPFIECQFHPVLVLSFMGEKLGRIIQASYDGKEIVLQYSQLWSFTDEETAPVEMSLRYRLSEAVGGYACSGDGQQHWHGDARSLDCGRVRFKLPPCLSDRFSI